MKSDNDKEPFIGLQVDSELKKDLEKSANENCRSVSSHIRFILKSYLNEQKRQDD